jgi:hypothetical protein
VRGPFRGRPFGCHLRRIRRAAPFEPTYQCLQLSVRIVELGVRQAVFAQGDSASNWSMVRSTDPCARRP